MKKLERKVILLIFHMILATLCSVGPLQSHLLTCCKLLLLERNKGAKISHIYSITHLTLTVLCFYWIYLFTNKHPYSNPPLTPSRENHPSCWHQCFFSETTTDAFRPQPSPHLLPSLSPRCTGTFGQACPHPHPSMSHLQALPGVPHTGFTGGRGRYLLEISDHTAPGHPLS